MGTDGTFSPFLQGNVPSVPEFPPNFPNFPADEAAPASRTAPASDNNPSATSSRESSTSYVIKPSSGGSIIATVLGSFPLDFRCHFSGLSYSQITQMLMFRLKEAHGFYAGFVRNWNKRRI